MSRTIKRGPPPKRPAPRKKQPVAKVSIMDRLVGMLPVSEETLAKIVTWTFTGAAAAAVLGAAIWFGVPGLIGGAIAQGAGKAGFRVEQIEVTGLKRMDRMSVYAVALEDKQNETSMLSVDLDAIRQRLLRYGWIADAHVSRRLPDTLLIDIVERKPAAVWQDNGQLTLIDSTGVLLEPVQADAIPNLPLVIGPGADRQEAAYQTLLSAAPALKPRITAATWVGNRRWDLTFESGETLLLPEDGAPGALVKFAELDGARPLLGRGWLRFDMRDPDKLVARKPGSNVAHAVADPGDAPKGQPSGIAAASGREG
ncbi:MULTISPECIES: cell division protein FtsQ/DivIB [unclassified Sphingomonas]|uniref:cell division protein FtsQ/DivIB n=1 Tax=unclassified Sphingomonas TaxID=196159 RepID=UPI00226ADA95